MVPRRLCKPTPSHGTFNSAHVGVGSKLLGELLAELPHGGFRGSLGGVDYLHAGRDRGLDEWAQQRVMGAAEHQGVWPHALSRSLDIQFVEIDPNHLGGNRMIRPAFFHQRHQQRAGLFECSQALALQAAAYAWLWTVASVAITSTSPVLLAARAA